jgi:hypothetical protein
MIKNKLLLETKSSENKVLPEAIRGFSLTWLNFVHEVTILYLLVAIINKSSLYKH